MIWIHITLWKRITPAILRVIGPAGLTNGHLIAPGKFAFFVYHNHLAILYRILNQICQLLWTCIRIFHGNAASHLIVVQVHGFCIRRISRSLMRRSKLFCKFTPEFTGHQGIPVCMAKRISMPVGLGGGGISIIGLRQGIVSNTFELIQPH